MQINRILLASGVVLSVVAATPAGASTLLLKTYENGVLRGIEALNTSQVTSGYDAVPVNAVGYGTRTGQTTRDTFDAYYLGGGSTSLGIGAYEGPDFNLAYNQQVFASNPLQTSNVTFSPGTFNLRNADGSIYRTIVVTDITNTPTLFYFLRDPNNQNSAFFTINNDPSTFVPNGQGGFSVSADGYSTLNGQNYAISNVTFDSAPLSLTQGLSQAIISFGDTNIYGYQQFSGTNANPTLRYDGSLADPSNAFYVSEPATANPYNSTSPNGTLYSVLFSTGVAALPEQTTWIMMIAGFGAVGAALRRRRNDGRVAGGESIA